MNIAVIYHDADFDGKLSNEVCRHWLKKLYPEANIHSYGWDYGRPVPSVFLSWWDPQMGDQFSNKWEDYDSIYIVDLSVDELMSRPELRDKIVWIDHHKSAIEKWDKLADIGDKPYPYFQGYRIDGVAACRLCWQWFCIQELPLKNAFINRTVSEPELIRLAGEYDVWDHREPDAKALQFGLRGMDSDELLDLIRKQFNNSGSEFDNGMAFVALRAAIASGRAIKSFCDIQNREYAAKHAHTIQWEGLTFCALNTSGRSSDHFDGAVKPEHDGCFCWRYDGRVVSVSLYSVPGKDIDLSVIAIKYGGGGHRGACGFRTTLQAIDKILCAGPNPT